MKKIFIAWEFGVGLGHVARIKAVCETLLKNRGVEIYIASCDLGSVEKWLTDLPVKVLPGPPLQRGNRSIETVYTYAHLLFNCGFSDTILLAARLRAWRNLIQQVGPDVVITDHSPSAILACQDLVPTIAMGTGFELPPPKSPLPNLRSVHVSDDRLSSIEDEIVSITNQALMRNTMRRIDKVYEIVLTSQQLLMTYSDLDPYGPREGATDYIGFPLVSLSEKLPVWPSCGDVRVIAYSQPGERLEHLVRLMIKEEFCSIVVVPGISATQRKNLESDQSYCNLSDALDLPKAIHDCDAVVTYGGHGTVVTALQGSKPVVVSPVSLEQQLTAERIEFNQLGIFNRNPDSLAKSIRKAVNSAEVTAAVSDFSRLQLHVRWTAKVQALAF